MPSKKIKHYFRFIYPISIGLVEIDEPIGFDAVPFNIEQEEKRMGRDVSYVGSNEAKFTIHKNFNHYFDHVLRAWEEKGFELQIEKLTETFGILSSDGMVSEISTNNYDTISFVLKPRLEQQRFKRNYDTTVDLLSGTDVNGKPIPLIQKYRFLANALPIYKRSIWNLNQFQFNYERPTEPNEFAFFTNGVYFNPIQIQEQYDINSSLSGGIVNFNTDTPDSFRYMVAAQNIENLKIRFDLDVLYKYRPNEFTSAGDKAGSLGLYVRWGQTLDTSQGSTPIWYDGSQAESDANFQLPSVIEYVIPNLNQTDIVWIYWRVGSQNAAVNRILFRSAKITADATQVSDSTVVTGIRLVDAMAQTVKSASGLNIDAPKFVFGKKYYPIMLTSSALMRYIFDKPFNTSIKDICENGLPFCNGDYQFMPDNTVYFGTTRTDFYRNVEIGTYLHPLHDENMPLYTPEIRDQVNMVIEEYEQRYNDRAYLKSASLRFSKYASLKEIPQDGTYGIVHGETEKKLPNINADGVLAITVGWVFDPYSFEDEREKASEISKDTATQDNDTVYAVEVAPLVPGQTKRITKVIRHEVQPNPVVLSLLNTGDFSFVQLGIVINTTFVINNTANAGTYNVIEVTDTVIRLVRVSPGLIYYLPTENTNFTYVIDPTVVLQTRTNEGINNIQGIDNGDRFGNLAYTADRILHESYGDNIATGCINHPNELIRSTDYKNNPGASTTIDNVTIVEGSNFIGYDGVNHPILSDKESTISMIMRFSEMKELYRRIQVDRGYIRTIQPNGYPVLFYPKQLSGVAITKDPDRDNDYIMFVSGVGEEKYIPFYMTILSDGVNPVVINGITQPSGIRFVIKKGKLNILDENGRLLFNPTPYNRISINNSPAFTSISQLGVALSFIQ